MPVGPEGIIVASVTPTTAPRGGTVTFDGEHLDLLAGLYLGITYDYPFTLDSVTSSEITAQVHPSAPLEEMVVTFDYQGTEDVPGLYYAGWFELLYFTPLAGVSGGWGFGVRMIAS